MSFDDIVRRWADEIRAHPALDALRAYDARLAHLDARSARAFVASLYFFNRATPAGIAQLAGRWADALMATEPFDAHRIASSILASAVDEFGLAGTRPHLEIFASFAARWDIDKAALTDASSAVPAARELGACVDRWYRTAPLGVALAVHFVSEETSNEEFAGWYPRFPDAEYTRVHAQLEPGHSNQAGASLARHLAAHPDDAAAARSAIEEYLELYRAMWEQLGG